MRRPSRDQLGNTWKSLSGAVSGRASPPFTSLTYSRPRLSKTIRRPSGDRCEDRGKLVSMVSLHTARVGRMT
ncbi:hypothetical protein D3C80_833900 [compost metagenome]